MTYTADPSDVNKPLDGDYAQVAARELRALKGYVKGLQANIDPLAKVISVKDFGAVCDGVTDDTASIQAALNAAPTDSYVLVPGLSKITSTITLKTRVHLIGRGKFGGGLLGDFNGPLLQSVGQVWRNSFSQLSFKNNNSGASAGCIKGTFYQGTLKECQFESTYGYGIYLDNADYCVENVIKDNYFYQSKYGIYAVSGGSYSNTDAFVVDNLFNGGATTVNHIYWSICSGTVFRGNHFYSSCSRYYMELNSGINVNVEGNYFESHTNARLYINPGNPGSFNVVHNRFWGGNGSSTDLNGNSQSLIELNLTAGVSQAVNISGNSFDNGSNSVNLIRTGANFATNGFSTVRIIFSASNILRGSYTLGVNVFRVDCGLRTLDRIISSAGQSLGMAGSVDRYTYNGAATDTVYLPDSASNNNMDGRTFVVYNETTTTDVTVSTASPYVGSKRIFSGDAVEFSNRSGTWYATKLARGPIRAYSTAGRPASLGTADAGFTYYASGLATPRMVIWTGTDYRDGAGAVI